MQAISSFVIYWKGMLTDNVYLFIYGLFQVVQAVWSEGTCKGCRRNQSDVV
jgi:hypothetical protein